MQFWTFRFNLIAMIFDLCFQVNVAIKKMNERKNIQLLCKVLLNSHASIDLEYTRFVFEKLINFFSGWKMIKYIQYLHKSLKYTCICVLKKDIKLS